MPKRPPRVVRELPVPHDLRGDGPTCALAIEASGSSEAPARGELWHADVMALLGRLEDGSVDLVVADPPYAIAKAEWDEFTSLEVYLDWCDGWLAEVARVLAPHGSAYVCGFSEILADVKARCARRFAGCRWLVWYYRNKANLGRDWGRSHESILHLRNAGARIDVDAIRVPYNGHTTKYPARVQAVSSQYGGASARRERWEPNPLGAKPRDVIELPVICNGMAEKTPHATQKPEALIEKLILASSTPGQLVVDPFVGSGTTAVVAARLGRSWIAGDSDPRFVGLTRERLSARASAAEHLPKPRSAQARRDTPSTAVNKLPERRNGDAQEPVPQEPVAQEPSTQEPSTQEPSTQEPSTQEPSTQEPSTQEPSTQEPSTQSAPLCDASTIAAGADAATPVADGKRRGRPAT